MRWVAISVFVLSSSLNYLDRLLLAAAELLHEAGDGTASTRAICARAGVQAPTLYHHFGSKQGLIDAVIQHGFNQYVDPARSPGEAGTSNAWRFWRPPPWRGRTGR